MAFGDKKNCKVRDFGGVMMTPGVDCAANAIYDNGHLLIGVADEPVAANTPGWFSRSGEYSFPAPSALVLNAGDKVPCVFTSSIGAIKTAGTGETAYYIGLATRPKVSGETVVYVELNLQNVTSPVVEETPTP